MSWQRGNTQRDVQGEHPPLPCQVKRANRRVDQPTGRTISVEGNSGVPRQALEVRNRWAPELHNAGCWQLQTLHCWLWHGQQTSMLDGRWQNTLLEQSAQSCRHQYAA